MRWTSEAKIGQELARYTDDDGYTVSIEYGTEPDHGEELEVAMGKFKRTGRIVITSPKGYHVEAGVWMDAPEPEWKIDQKTWRAMPIEKRAAMEVAQQATAYAPLRKQFAGKWCV